MTAARPLLVLVERDMQNATTTLSRITIDGVLQCYGLEDAGHTRKIPGVTRIPAGEYRLGLRTEGRLARRYAEDLELEPCWRGMIEIRAVPDFAAVLIHPGNTADDTAGCLLVGRRRLTADPVRWRLGESLATFRALYRRIVSDVAAGSARIRFVDAFQGG